MKFELCLFSYAGVEPQTLECIMSELGLCRSRGVAVTFRQVHSDALISRSRSAALSVLLKTDGDVFCMVDHDLEWRPGDLLGIADAAMLKKACVAGFYATRARGLGYSGRLKEERARVKIGEDKLHEAEYVPGGFTAIHRSAVERVLALGRKSADEKMPIGEEQRAEALALRECIGMDGTPFWDFFRPIVVTSTLVPGKHEYLSEDFAFSWRCAQADVPQFLSSRPVLAHWGLHGFTMAESVQAASPTLSVK